MATVPDNHFQLIIADPPYDIHRAAMMDFHSEFKRICKGDILVFCPPENQWLFPDCKLLFWCKSSSTKNYSKNYGRFVEMIFRYPRSKSKFNSNLHWSNYTGCYNDVVVSTEQHPYKKPESLIERLIRIHSDPGDLIFDPFAGSGTVEDCGTRLGRIVTSCEIAQASGIGRIL